MRVVVALGGNALLQRGQPLTAENQRANARGACSALAPVALEHELVISHGNGPQVGLLALQGSAYHEVETYPLDVLDAETEGMIGYVLQQELGNELPQNKPLATLLTQIEVDPADPAFENPTKPIGPVYDKRRADALAAEKGWAFRPDGNGYRRVVPSPWPRRIYGLEPVEWLLEHGCVVVCAGGGGIPVRHTDEPVPAGRRLVGVEAVIDKDLASALLAAELRADVLAIVTDVDAVYSDWGAPAATAIRRASPQALADQEFAAGSMGPKVMAACKFVQETGGLAAIGSIADAAALVRAEAGTVVALDAAGLELATAFGGLTATATGAARSAPRPHSDPKSRRRTGSVCPTSPAPAPRSPTPAPPRPRARRASDRPPLRRAGDARRPRWDAS
jgi:carbamate kinase